jgi:hypothetical protein
MQVRLGEIAILNASISARIWPTAKVVSDEAPREPAAFQKYRLPPKILQLPLDFDIAVDQARPGHDQRTRRNPDNKRATPQSQIMTQIVQFRRAIQDEPFVRYLLIAELNHDTLELMMTAAAN